MAVLLNVRDIDSARYLAGLVNALYYPDRATAVPLLVKERYGGNVSPAVSPRLFPVPPWCWFDGDTQTVVAVTGVLTVADGLGVFAGSVLGPVPVSTWGAHSLSLDAARAILPFLPVGSVFAPRDWVLTGHSYGGSIVCALAGLLVDSGLARSVNVLTFGSPRPGDAGQVTLLSRLPVRRYMTELDAVPRYPPHVDEAPALTLALPSPVARNFALFQQPYGGVVLYAGGTARAGALPPLVAATLEGQLALAALYRTIFASADHSMLEYIGRLDLVASGGKGLAAGPTVGSWTEAAAAAVMTTTGGGQFAGETPTPSQNGGTSMAGYIPPAFRAVEHNMGANVYKVVWMGQTILTGQSKSNAHTLAKYFNSFLRRMQTADSADHGNFSVAWSQYWSVCTEATLGFNPPLEVT